MDRLGPKAHQKELRGTRHECSLHVPHRGASQIMKDPTAHARRPASPNPTPIEGADRAALPMEDVGSLAVHVPPGDQMRQVRMDLVGKLAAIVVLRGPRLETDRAGAPVYLLPSQPLDLGDPPARD